MLKKILLTAALIIVPLVVYTAIQYGEMKTVTFEEARQIAAGQSDTEKAPKVMIRGQVLNDGSHSIVQHGSSMDFTLRDANMVDFQVSYTGADKVDLEHMQTIGIVGHVHEGTPPYFHASQIILNY